MRVLIVKTSSLGDVVHTLPALTDAARALPGLVFDWAVEESFAEIPAWHPAVARVLPVAVRRWRKSWWKTVRGGELRRARAAFREQPYDLVIDAQGLYKSAWIARWAGAPIAGLDRQSAREPLASLSYQRRFAVPREMHAVERTRLLFALALGYELPVSTGDYGIDRARFTAGPAAAQVVFLHGTTRAAKHWPEPYWCELAQQVRAAGFRVLLPWGNEAERERAERIAAASGAEVLPRLTLAGVASILAASRAAVAVDTGLGHLAAALSLPTVSLYGPTRPVLVGAYGRDQVHLSAAERPAPADTAVQPPAMAPLTPALVWQTLQPLLTPAER
jgi:heptosyltransferase-1